MRRQLTQFSLLTLSLLCAVAVAAGAQDSTRARARSSERARDSMMVRTRSPGRTFIYSLGPDDLHLDMRRGRLGITVDLRPDAARDTIGARVSGVTPGGPADRAGVQTGDIITRLNGARLAVTDRPGEADAEQSRPGMRLINLASRVDPGDTVRLDLLRENRPLTLSFVADRTDMDQLVERMRIPGNGQAMMRVPGMGMFGEGMPGMGAMRVFTEGGMGDLELVKVSPQLAEGLGIAEGLLVVAVDSGSMLGLRAGDVITGIGGRRPTSPPQAMRILSTYEPNETVAFDVMRQHRRTTVNGRMPEPRRGEAWRVRPNNFEFNFPRRPDEPMMRFFDEELPRIMEMLPRELPRKSMIRFDGKV